MYVECTIFGICVNIDIYLIYVIQYPSVEEIQNVANWNCFKVNFVLLMTSLSCWTGCVKKKLQTNKIWESSELYIIYRAVSSLKHDYMVHHLLTGGWG